MRIPWRKRKGAKGAFRLAYDIATESGSARSAEALRGSVRFAEAKVEEMQRMGFVQGELAARGMLAGYQAELAAAEERERTANA